MKTLLSIALLSVSLAATAAPKESAGHWTGSGTTYDRQGKQLGDFVVDVQNTSPDADTIDSVATVSLPGGETKTFKQHIVVNGEDGFTVTSDDGKGRGGCFGEGLCEMYVGDEKHGVATTIVHDGRNGLRFLSTELDNGQPVHIIRQRLERAN